MPSSNSSSSSSDGYDLALRLLLSVLAIAVPLAHLAWLSGNITAYLTEGGWAPYQPTAALLHPQQVWPTAGETSLLVGARIVPVTLLLALAAVIGLVWARHRSQGGGRKKKITDMAKARDIEPLMAKAITDKARSLRPSLKDAKHIDAKDTGILLGNLQGSRHEVRMGFEDVAVAIMAPRSGKTTSLAIPSMLGAPGPVLLTSNKAAGDAFTTAYEARARAGTVWTMDPQQIAHADREMWWNPLAGATTLDGANRLAGHFLAASVDASQQGDFWSKAGSNILSQLLLAAALDERPITDIMQWLAFPADRTPLDILRDHDFTAVAAQLKGTVEGPPETRDGIYETARQYAAALLNSEIAAWVTPQKDVAEFRPEQFVTSTDTLFLLSKDGGGGASALIAACADSVMRAATAQAERAGGRLDPPMLAILDEAANVCKISDLPDLYSHLGSRGSSPSRFCSPTARARRSGETRAWTPCGPPPPSRSSAPASTTPTSPTSCPASLATTTWKPRPPPTRNPGSRPRSACARSASCPPTRSAPCPRAPHCASPPACAPPCSTCGRGTGNQEQRSCPRHPPARRRRSPPAPSRSTRRHSPTSGRPHERHAPASGASPLP